MAKRGKPARKGIAAGRIKNQNEMKAETAATGKSGISQSPFAEGTKLDMKHFNAISSSKIAGIKEPQSDSQSLQEKWAETGERLTAAGNERESVRTERARLLDEGHDWDAVRPYEPKHRAVADRAGHPNRVVDRRV